MLSRRFQLFLCVFETIFVAYLFSSYSILRMSLRDNERTISQQQQQSSTMDYESRESARTQINKTHVEIKPPKIRDRDWDSWYKVFQQHVSEEYFMALRQPSLVPRNLSQVKSSATVMSSAERPVLQLSEVCLDTASLSVHLYCSGESCSQLESATQREFALCLIVSVWRRAVVLRRRCRRLPQQSLLRELRRVHRADERAQRRRHGCECA